MSTAKPNLASWERRVLAAALDATLLAFAIVFLAALGETVHLSSVIAMAVLPVAYLAYHSSSLLQPEIGLGRTVAGISVISVRGSGELTRVQAVVRPLVRVLALGLTLAVGSSTDREWLMAVPLLVELALIAHTPWRQSIADLMAGTVVIRTPQAQPHRAPAGPMYSATDAEFGTRPRGKKKPERSIGD
jgi:uncharacterized RDD family membrane protein YckC